MDSLEPLSGDKNELTLNRQLDLVANARTLEGIKEFGDALISGCLTKTINLVLEPGFEPVEMPHFGHEPFETIVSYGLGRGTSESQRNIGIETDTDPDRPQVIEIRGFRWPRRIARGIDQNKGLAMQLTYRLVDDPQGQRKVQFDGGLIYVQTSSDKMAYDAAIIIDKDGAVNDVLPPGDYHAERLYGSTIGEGEKRVKDHNLPFQAIHHLDQLEGSLEGRGIKLAHHRSENEYTGLQSEVASLFDIDRGKLLASKIDHKASFEAMMNNPLNIIPSLDGAGEITVPQIIFS